MSNIAIAVKNLSKRYMVGHRSAQRENYTALRDVLSREARNFARKAIDVFRGRPIVQGDEIEEFWALKDVSFEVERGKVLGIIGRNGAGKSTLLKVLSRITEPDRGQAILHGRVASLLEVGTGFHPELTGRENIFLNGGILGMRRAEIKRKFDEIVEFSEAEKFLDTPVKRYSTGMYMRLAFAVAAHLEAEILIVDEVLAVGDASFQRKCLGKIQDVAQHGRTILFVSHNMAAVENMCNSALLLIDGQVVSQGTTSAVVQKYLGDLNSATATPLNVRTDRAGSGDIHFSSLSLEGSDGSSVSAFKCGAEATLHFIAENRSDQKVRGFRLGLNIDNEMGQRVAYLDTMLVDAEISDISPGRWSVRVVIPKMALTPGRYRLTIFSTINGIISDWIKNAAIFDVEAGDYYGTGQLPERGDMGMLLLPHHFKMSKFVARR